MCNMSLNEKKSIFQEINIHAPVSVNWVLFEF